MENPPKSKDILFLPRVRKRGSFGKRGLFRKVHFLEDLEFLENPQTVEKKGDSDHFLEILGM